MTGQDAISPQRLAEIREIDAAFDTTKPHPFPTRVYAHRRELLTEVDRLTTALAEAERQVTIGAEGIDTYVSALTANNAEREQLAARVAELEAELADAREANQNMREATKRQREQQHCGRSMNHPAHRWALGRQVAQCPGTVAASDRSDRSGQ